MSRQNFILLIVLLCTFFLGMIVAPAISVMAQPEGDTAYTTVYDAVVPSVVSISVDQYRAGIWQPWSTGTGFVVDHAGHIITNYHVVEGGERIVLNFYDNTIVLAELVGFDAASDLALLKVDLPMIKLQPVTFADTSEVAVGQTTLAIGSPFGQNWTLTSGIISALDRTITGFTQFEVGAVIQTDAAINPGNSGGPLLNLNGEVIGINAQILSEQASNSGIGFAIPANLVQRVIREIVETGQVTYSYLGINGVDMTIDIIENYNLPNDIGGIAITNVATDSPAGVGGLLNDSPTSIDVVTELDGQPLSGFDMLVGYLAGNTRPGDVVTMRVYRDGQYRDVNIVLGVRP